MKIILKIIAGSKLHGTNIEGVSDTDYLGIFLENPKDILGFSQKDVIVSRDKPVGVKSSTEDEEQTLYGLRKFLSLALKGNPTILTLLFAPRNMLTEVTKEGFELQSLTSLIVSKKVIGPFQGYMRQQYERLIGERGQKNIVRPELVAKYGYDTKYASHVVRLGLQGEELLLTGRLELPMPIGTRGYVIDIRNGKFSFEAVCKLIEDIELRLKEAYNKSSLREEPSYSEVEDFMIKTYLNYWNENEKTNGTDQFKSITGYSGLRT
jgi:predicted nucleotidyltransferase